MQRHSFKNRQQGFAILDALVAMLLALVIGLGALYVAAKGAVVQRQTGYQHLAVLQLRSLLQTQAASLCGTTPTITVTKATGAQATVLSLPVTVTCTSRAATGITIGGQAVNPTTSGAAKEITLSVTSSALFGGSGTLMIDQGGS